MSGLTLDAGALIAIERDDRLALTMLRQAVLADRHIVVPAGALAQVWRDGARQARLSRFLRTPQVLVPAMDDELARQAGKLCGLTGTSDVIDASVAIVGRAWGGTVMTSDPDDLYRLDPSLDLLVV
jgi:hypothetical protein